jgi:hypothetical protein
MERKAPDMPLLANDILYVPDNKGRRMTLGALEKLVLDRGPARRRPGVCSRSLTLVIAHWIRGPTNMPEPKALHPPQPSRPTRVVRLRHRTSRSVDRPPGPLPLDPPPPPLEDPRLRPRLRGGHGDHLGPPHACLRIHGHRGCRSPDAFGGDRPGRHAHARSTMPTSSWPPRSS